MQYTCSQCGASVSYVDGVITRQCDHNDSGVLAHMIATAYGEGGARGEDTSMKAAFLSMKAAFLKLFSALWDRTK